MRPNLQEEDLVDRDTALYEAQSQAPPSTCSAWTAAPAVTRYRGQPTEPLGRCDVSSSRVRNSAKYVPQQRRFRARLRYLPQTFAICLKPSLFALNLHYLRYTMRLETKERGCPLE
jgi:hypothetical protein